MATPAGTHRPGQARRFPMMADCRRRLGLGWVDHYAVMLPGRRRPAVPGSRGVRSRSGR
jgi:hypothetical protein